jgi:hypothetical protein
VGRPTPTRAQVHAHGIVAALGRFLGLGLGQDLLLDLDQLAASTLSLFVGHLALFVGKIDADNRNPGVLREKQTGGEDASFAS